MDGVCRFEFDQLGHVQNHGARIPDLLDSLPHIPVLCRAVHLHPNLLNSVVVGGEFPRVNRKLPLISDGEGPLSASADLLRLLPRTVCRHRDLLTVLHYCQPLHPQQEDHQAADAAHPGLP